MKKLTEQEEKELKVLNENLKKHEETLKGEEAKKQNVGMAEQMLRIATKDLDEHMVNMLERAKRLVQDLERNQVRYFSERENSKSAYFQYSLDEVDNCFSNYRMANAAKKLAKYEKTEIALKIYKEEKVNLW